MARFAEGVEIPLRPFAGVMGVAPATDSMLSTIPPRANGGNMDNRHMVAGTTVYFPVFVEGALFSIGDTHAAQGDGEVSGTAIEMGAVVRVSTEIRKGMGQVIKGPEVEGGNQIKNMEPSQFYQTIGYPLKTGGEVPAPLQYLESEKIKNLENLSEDLTLAARDALIKMIAYIQREYGLTAEQAYILASVAVDLRVGQVVDVPNYVVTAVLNEDVFVNPRRR